MNRGQNLTFLEWQTLLLMDLKSEQMLAAQTQPMEPTSLWPLRNSLLNLATHVNREHYARNCKTFKRHTYRT